jgi:hypothetical protein
MWFEPIGLEQATAEVVARHKARRFAGRAVDLCCGIGGDTIALAGAGVDVLAVDIDPGMCRRSRWNAGIYGVDGRVAVVRARAESVVIPGGAWVHIDPDRRTRGSQRARRIDDYQPGRSFLQSLAASATGGAIKLGPASDFQSHFRGSSFEIEVISLAGECKEATVWFGEAKTCQRRATRLPEGGTWTDLEVSKLGVAGVGPVLGWVFDPDPSLARAGLLEGFAVAHGLSQFVDGVDFLTGPGRVDSPFLAPFEVEAVFPLDLKTLRREVASRDVGTLEVKTKGIDLRPEEVRKRLRPEGDRPATLLLAGGSDRPCAILARRVTR